MDPEGRTDAIQEYIKYRNGIANIRISCSSASIQWVPLSVVAGILAGIIVEVRSRWDWHSTGLRLGCY